MSLAIDVDMVTDVLLQDGWHEVKGGSFAVDAYEYLEFSGGRDPRIVHGGGAGFSFIETDNSYILGPMTAILAVKSEKQSKR